MIDLYTLELLSIGIPLSHPLGLFDFPLYMTAAISFLHQKAYVHEVLLYMLVSYLCQISASILGWFGEVQVPDLPACSPEQPVSRMCRMLCQLPHSISLHLKQVVLIGNLSKCVDLPQMYCDVLSRYLNPGIVPLPNFLPAVVF